MSEGVEFVTINDARRKGLTPYAGPYKSVTERWMIDNASMDILKNHRDYPYLVKMGKQIEIWIIPNFYGSHPHPVKTLAKLASEEHKHLLHETFVQVEDAERRTAEISIAKKKSDQ